MATITPYQVELLGGAAGFQSLPPEDALEIIASVEDRLLGVLCMECPPKAGSKDYRKWLTLLATAIATFGEVKDYTGIEHERVRNYEYRMGDMGGSWELLSHKAADLLAHFNKCSAGISMQTDLTGVIYGRGVRAYDL